MVTIVIFKWLFVFAAIWLGYYHYKLEREKISLISKHIDDSSVRAELRSNARRKMLYLVALFTAFIAWVMSYDLIIDSVKKRNFELARELEKTSQRFENLSKNQQRLVVASREPNKEVIEDIKEYYTDIFVNYYIMRKCDMIETDDVFIINSALLRELGLNHLPFELREEVINDAKAQYLSKYADFECDQVYGRYNNIIKNYQNYVIAVREVLRATF